MLSYTKWNEAIFHHFFNETKSERRVSLALDSDSLSEIANARLDLPNSAEEDFTLAVRRKIHEPPVPFQNILLEADEWWMNETRPIPPPFVAFLGACALAASKMEMDEDRGIAAHNYYERLQEILDVRSIAPRQRWRMTKLWERLIEWLQMDLEGSFGLCDAEPLGNSRYGQKGYPESQCLMREADRDHLPDFFQWAGLSPGDNIDLSLLSDCLRAWAERTTSKFSNPLKKRLHVSNEIRLAIAEKVLDEFVQWDGVVQDDQGKSGREIKLCAERDDDGSWSLFFFLPKDSEFPEGEFRSSDATFTLATSPLGPDWYNPTPAIDVTTERLQEGYRLERDRYFLKFRGARLFILEWGGYEFSCWVERNRPRIGTEFLIVCHRNLRNHVIAVLENFAEEGWTEVARARIPREWTLFKKVKMRQVADDLPDALSALRPATKVRLKLEGGLRLHRRYAYLQGGEPIVIVGQTERPVDILLNGQVIAQAQGEGTEVPLASLNLSPGTYEIRVGDKTHRFEIAAARARSVYSARSTTETLSHRLMWQSGEYRPVRFGCEEISPNQQPRSGEIRICGATLSYSPDGEPDPAPSVLTLKTSVKEYIFLGRRPGMAKTLKPDKRLDKLRIAFCFEPEWMIKRGGRRWRVIPLGKPKPPEVFVRLDGAQHWADWFLNRHNRSPKHFFNVWRQYVKAAKLIKEEMEP
jgi:hypothetical protein